MHGRRLIKAWHQSLGSAFDSTAYTSKAHLLIHLPDVIHKHGSGQLNSNYFGKCFTCIKCIQLAK